MEKQDFKTTYKALYLTKARDFELVDVPPLPFLMLDGRGNPNTTPLYSEVVQALYSVSYALKFASKEAPGVDYSVMPLEGLWWADDMDAFTARAKDQWIWTMMIMQPGWVDAAMLERAKAKSAKKIAVHLLDALRLETYAEGLSAQVLHIGSYDDETPTLHRLHAEYLPQNGLAPSGKHHEIYLGDPRKTAPEKLKTILRQPVCKMQ